MTSAKMYEHICAMLRQYDQETGRNDAEKVIARPADFAVLDKLPYYAFYSSAAAMLIEARRGMDSKVTPKTAISAINRIIKSVQPGREQFKEIFPYGGKYVICDGFRLIRLNEDISGAPHVENNFDVDGVMRGIDSCTESLEIPSVADLKTHIAATSYKSGKVKSCKPYLFKGSTVYVNPKYLIDMIQSLPGCTAAYNPGQKLSLVYFSADNGDGILMPVRPPKTEVTA